jgi:hypothetical protein
VAAGRVRGCSSVLIRYWPDLAPWEERAEMTDWLSMKSETFFPIVSGVFDSIHNARSAPMASAS